MKKLLKQSICLLAVLCIIAGLGPARAQAYEKKGEYRIHSMSEGRWITEPKDNPDYIDVYKMRISSDGYIKVKVNNDKCTGRHVNRASALLFTTYKVNAETSGDYFVAGFYSGEN